jgi:hypothetical protein
LLLCDFAESHFKHQGLVRGYQTGNDGEQQLQPLRSETKQTLLRFMDNGYTESNKSTGFSVRIYLEEPSQSLSLQGNRTT